MEDNKHIDNHGFRPMYKKSKVNSDKNNMPSRLPSNRVDTGSKVSLARKFGYYNSIKYTIRKIKKNKPEATFDDVVDALCLRYPTVFGPMGNIRNTRAVIESDNGWCLAYYDYDDSIVDRIEERMSSIVLKDTDSDVEIMSKYELIKKYEILKDRAISERIKVKAELQAAENECKRLDKLLDKAAEEAIDNSIDVEINITQNYEEE